MWYRCCGASSQIWCGSRCLRVLIPQAIDNPRWLTGPKRPNEFDWSLLTHMRKLKLDNLDDHRWQHHREAFETWINVRAALASSH